MAKADLVEIFKKRTRHPYRPRASHIIDRLFHDFEAIEWPIESFALVESIMRPEGVEYKVLHEWGVNQ